MNGPFSRERAPSVLLISLDTLRADVAYSGKFPTMEKLRREGTSFKTVVSSSPLTPISHATILTGVQPARHGVRHLLREQIVRSVPTLASILTDVGYSTGAVVSCPGLNSWYGIGRGFQHYDDEIPRLPDGRNAFELADVKLRGLALKRAPLVVSRALEWLAAGPSRPFFLFAHFFDAHWPYEAPAQYDVPIANAYEGEVAYMDHHLGDLLSGIERLGYPLDEMLVVCLSDHGEDLGGWYPNDHAGERGHPEEEGHGCLLFDATQLVPLWIRSPKIAPAGKHVTRQVRLLDVMPTVLDMLGLPLPDVDGESLRPFFGAKGSSAEDPPDRPAFCETYFREELALSDSRFADLKPLNAVRLARKEKVIWELGGPSVEVYDLVNDPNELHPLDRVAGRRQR